MDFDLVLRPNGTGTARRDGVNILVDKFGRPKWYDLRRNPFSVEEAVRRLEMDSARRNS